ncbi:MAG: alpha-L-fucosidase [Bacteroidetes bacterium]|jgi:alpha-L-fucosidase|nr:alpha-L-fucosidase [Bacteroidota bacterium]
MKKTILTLLSILLITLSFACQSSETSESTTENTLSREEILNESKEAFDERMEWWRDAKFGLFIHWGPYAVPAGVHNGERITSTTGEWIMNGAQIPVEEYEEYARQFNPTKYDADDWVRIAKDAGMKYIIITSKHHDGFALWGSEVGNYNSVDFAEIGKDLLDELKEAADKHDIKLGFYYSIMDWHHPDAQAPHYPTYNTSEKTNSNFDEYVENYMTPQVRELVEEYEPAVLWFDGEWIPEWTHEHAVDMYTMLRQMDPEMIINNRVDVGRQGMQGMNEEGGEFVGDFGTPEQEILESTSDFDWEACMTMNDTWGYKSYDDNWKPSENLIFNLVDVAAKGGNYLLNVGPTAEGLIPEVSVERLSDMGDWMDINSEAIYETERLQNHFREGESIRYTKKKAESTYYGIIFEEPTGTIQFSYLQPDEGSDVMLLGYEDPLNWEFNEENGLSIQIPAEIRNAENLSTAWVFKINGSEVN